MSFIHSDCWIPLWLQEGPCTGTAFQANRLVYGPTRLRVIHVFGENGDAH